MGYYRQQGNEVIVLDVHLSSQHVTGRESLRKVYEIKYAFTANMEEYPDTYNVYETFLTLIDSDITIEEVSKSIKEDVEKREKGVEEAAKVHPIIGIKFDLWE